METDNCVKKYLYIGVLMLSLSTYAQGNAPIVHNNFDTNTLPVFNLTGMTLSNLVSIITSNITVSTITINSNVFSSTNFFASVNEQYVVYNGSNIALVNSNVYLAIISANTGLTNILCTNPFTYTKMMVSNSAATTNSFSIVTPFRAFGLLTTNNIVLKPGKMAFISFQVNPGVFTDMCSVPEP